MIPPEYIDKYGLVTPKPNMRDGSDNGPLFTAQACLLGLMTKSEAQSATVKCFVTGLLRRNPDSTEIGSPDNVIGAAILWPTATEVLIEHAGWRFFCPDGKFQWKALWYANMPGLRGLVKQCAGVGANLVERFFWNAGAIMTALSRKRDETGRLETSDRLLCETVILSDSARHIFYGWVLKWWRKKIDRDFGTDGRSWLNNMVRIYFGNHPFSDVWGVEK